LADFGALDVDRSADILFETDKAATTRVNATIGAVDRPPARKHLRQYDNNG